MTSIPQFTMLTQQHRKEAADKLVKLWDIETGEIIRTLEGHSEGISDIAWSQDGEYIASASDDKTIWIWSVETVCAGSSLYLS